MITLKRESFLLEGWFKCFEQLDEEKVLAQRNVLQRFIMVNIQGGTQLRSILFVLRVLNENVTLLELAYKLTFYSQEELYSIEKLVCRVEPNCLRMVV
jgi:hypothetical protein